jgi:P27 family predicted phage terminase small subunit
MTFGRKPKPAHLKMVDGNPGKRPIPKKKRHVPTGLRAPKNLTKDQRRYWRQSVKAAPHGLLRSCDAQALKRYVVALSIYDDAKAKLENSPSVIRTKSGAPINSPYLGILNRQADLLLRLEAEFGFTPSARTRLQFRDHDANFDEDQEEEDWFGV